MSVSKQFIRYCIVGVGSNAAAYVAFLLLIHFRMEAKVAMTFVYVAASTLSFLANRNWTFSHGGQWRSSAIRYAAVQLAGYLLNFSILMIFRDRFHFSPELVQACAIPVVAVALFVVSKLLVFRSPTIVKG